MNISNIKKTCLTGDISNISNVSCIFYIYTYYLKCLTNTGLTGYTWRKHMKLPTGYFNILLGENILDMIFLALHTNHRRNWLEFNNN